MSQVYDCTNDSILYCGQYISAGTFVSTDDVNEQQFLLDLFKYVKQLAMLNLSDAEVALMSAVRLMTPSKQKQLAQIIMIRCLMTHFLQIVATLKIFTHFSAPTILFCLVCATNFSPKTTSERWIALERFRLVWETSSLSLVNIC